METAYHTRILTIVDSSVISTADAKPRLVLYRLLKSVLRSCHSDGSTLLGVP